MENSHEESLLSAVEDFSPQPSPTLADFSDSERERGSSLQRGPVRRLITGSIYMTEGGEGMGGEDIREIILLDTKIIYAPECRMSLLYF